MDQVVRFERLSDIVQAVREGSLSVTVTVDNDEVSVYDDAGRSRYTARLDPESALIELLGDLGVKAERA